MGKNILLLFIVLALFVCVAPVMATSTVIVGLNGTTAPQLASYSFDKTTGYTLKSTQGLDGTVKQIAINHNPGADSGIYTAMTNGLVSAHALREYGINGAGALTFKRWSWQNFTDIAIGPDNGVYGFETYYGNVVRLAPSAPAQAGFTQTNAWVLESTTGNPKGGSAKLAATDDGQVMMIHNANPASSPQYNWLLPIKANSPPATTFAWGGILASGYIADKMVISPLDGTLWFDDSVHDGGMLSQWTHPNPISAAPLSCVSSISGHSGIYDLGILSDGTCIALADNLLNDGKTLMIAYTGHPTSSGGDGTITPTTLVELGASGTNFEMSIDGENTIHLLGAGYLTAWQLGSGGFSAFQQIQTGDGTAIGTFVPEPATLALLSIGALLIRKRK